MIAAVYCLIWTVACEALVYRFALHRREKILDLCLLNICTNLLLNVVLMRFSPDYHPYAIAVLEGVVVLVEWRAFAWLKLERPLFLSLVLNAASLFLGIAARELL